MGKVSRHVQEYIGRYAVASTVVLLPLSGLLGQLAADWGGADSRLGRIVLGASSVIGTAAAVGVWLRNLGLWETAPLVAQATAEANAATVTALIGGAVASDTDAGAPSVLPDLEDPEAAAVAASDLPADDEELGAPPPDESNTPVQPSEGDGPELPPRVG